MVPSRNVSIVFLDPENIISEEISKIYETESSVPHEPEVDLEFHFMEF